MPKKTPPGKNSKKSNIVPITNVDVESVLYKLDHFRGAVLKIPQTRVADDILLSQNIIHRLENGGGSIKNMVKLLVYYHLVHGLNLNSLFKSKYEVNLNTKDLTPLKKVDFDKEIDSFFEKLEVFRKEVIHYTQQQVCSPLNFTQNLVHRLEKGLGMIHHFLTLIIYYNQIHGLDINSAFNEKLTLKTDPNSLNFDLS